MCVSAMRAEFFIVFYPQKIQFVGEKVVKNSGFQKKYLENLENLEILENYFWKFFKWDTCACSFLVTLSCIFLTTAGAWPSKS